MTYYTEKETQTMLQTHQEDAEFKMYKTRNYSMFTPNPENRPVDIDRAMAIAKEIAIGNNYLSTNPITVNENLMIMKGHHRFVAAKIAGVEIYYIIDPHFRIQDAIREDIRTAHWTTKDHLDRYANNGVPEFVALRNFWKEYPWLTISNLIRLCAVGGYKKQEFPDGKYEIDRLDFARRVCNMALDFKPYFKDWHSKTFLDALLQLAVREKYSHPRMIRKFGYQTVKLQRQATVQQYLDVLSEIYNKRESEENHEFFHKTKKIFAPGRGYGVTDKK